MYRPGHHPDRRVRNTPQPGGFGLPVFVSFTPPVCSKAGRLATELPILNPKPWFPWAVRAFPFTKEFCSDSCLQGLELTP
jgi:hypothetical protein